MATTKKTEEAKVNKTVEETEKTAPEVTPAENAEVVETEKKDNFIVRGAKAYGKAFKAHPVKTIVKTVALPLTFAGGVMAGKAIFGESADQVIDVVADVVGDVAENVTEEVTE